MDSPRTDAYWDRIRLLIALLIGVFIAYMVTFIVRGVDPEAGLSFTTYPLVTLFVYSFVLLLFAAPVAFPYYASKDKRELAKDFEQVRTRHWVTIVLFLVFTYGIYSLWYLNKRRSYPRVDTAAEDPDKSGYGLLSWAARAVRIRFVGTVQKTLAKMNDGATGTTTETRTQTSANSTQQTSDEDTGNHQPFTSAITDHEFYEDTGPIQIFDGTYENDTEVPVRIVALDSDYQDRSPVVDAFDNVVSLWDGICKNQHVATVVSRSESGRPWVAFRRGESSLDERVPTLDTAERAHVVADIAEGIRTASMYNHSHTGLSPNVVQLQEGDQRPLATVADWGLQSAVRTAIGEPSVTPYTAPEQLTANSAGTKTDIYQLGAVAYFALCGVPPFSAAEDHAAAIRNGEFIPLIEREPSLPAGVDDVLGKALRTDPAERFDSPYTFKQKLLDSVQ